MLKILFSIDIEIQGMNSNNRYLCDKLLKPYKLYIYMQNEILILVHFCVKGQHFESFHWLRQ